jgi:hypothetical protein
MHSHSKRIALVCAFVLAGVAATASPAAREAAPCGGLASLRDGGRNVNLGPHVTTISQIASWPMPHPTPLRRRTRFQRHVWRVVAQITAYKVGRAGAIRLILFDRDSYMLATLPAPTCMDRPSRARTAALAARARFLDKCGHATGSWAPLGAVAYVSGIGFWSGYSHGIRGGAHNGAQLTPVTGLRFVAGCGA